MTLKQRGFTSQKGGMLLPWGKPAVKSPLPETLVGLTEGDVQVRAAGRGPGHRREERKDSHQTHRDTALSSHGRILEGKTKAQLPFEETRSGDTCYTDQSQSHVFLSSSLTSKLRLSSFQVNIINVGLSFGHLNLKCAELSF